MSKAIWKYPLEKREGKQVLLLPRGAMIKGVVVQSNNPVLYALVDPKVMEHRSFVIHAYLTGELIEDHEIRNFYPLGTVLFNEGRYVVHYYLEL